MRKPKPPLDSRSGDLAVLAELERAGADLSQPRELVHYLYVGSSERAEEAAGELRQLGYAVEIRPAAPGTPGDGRSWLALARIDAVADAERVQWERARFEQLAERLAGEYDGWEASV